MHDLGYLAQDISILHRSYYKDTAQAFKRLKLNPTAACIMIAVCDSPGINQQRISDYLAIDKGLTAREVAKLESSGYLRRVKGKENPSRSMRLPQARQSPTRHGTSAPHGGRPSSHAPASPRPASFCPASNSSSTP